MPSFQQYVEPAGATVEDGVYSATVTKAKVVLDDSGVPKKNDNGKCSIDVTFDLGEECEVRRRYSISFGQNRTNGQWAAFAKFLAVVSGTQPSDPRLALMEPEELLGKKCQVVISTNDKGYSNVDNVLAAKKATGKPQPSAPPPAVVEDHALVDEGDFPSDSDEPEF